MSEILKINRSRIIGTHFQLRYSSEKAKILARNTQLLNDIYIKLYYININSSITFLRVHIVSHTVIDLCTTLPRRFTVQVSEWGAKNHNNRI